MLSASLAVVLVCWALFHSQINRWLALRLLLTAESPRDELFQDLAYNSADPGEFLRRCWATGKIPHRQLVASFLKGNADANPGWFTGVESLVLAGTMDADMSVREMALATLQTRSDPRLFDQAKAQLNDLDPLVRQLGLDYLRDTDAQQGVPVVMPLLNDPDLRIVTRAEAVLRRWTNQDFGVRVRMAIHYADGDQAAAAQRDDEEKIRQGVARRKEWWSVHAKEFAKVPDHSAVIDTTPRVSAADFSLKDLDGNQVRLADFHGKVVLLNFWATWCTACLAEIPDLVALHKKLGERAVVLGVALDGLPDEHHHESNAQTETEEQSVGKSLEQIRTKVVRAVKARGIDYTVLLDPTGSVGGRFNGGELPTTVIIDSSGRVCRRFIGERNLGVFEAMVAEAAK